jgi:hypothetical protein
MGTLGVDVLEATDWSSLMHAYGSAVATPGHLRALVGSDNAAREAALSHLNGAVLHQGTPWTATAPAALVVARLLEDAHLDEVAEPALSGPPFTARAQLLRWLTGVVQAAGRVPVYQLEEWSRAWPSVELSYSADRGDEVPLEVMNALYARAVLACRRAVPLIADELLRWLDIPDELTRSVAATPPRSWR